eukprot:scaffold88196_cov35-Prasinocladus_malaysianus.AAC.1
MPLLVGSSSLGRSGRRPEAGPTSNRSDYLRNPPPTGSRYLPAAATSDNMYSYSYYHHDVNAPCSYEHVQRAVILRVAVGGYSYSYSYTFLVRAGGRYSYTLLVRGKKNNNSTSAQDRVAVTNSRTELAESSIRIRCRTIDMNLPMERAYMGPMAVAHSHLSTSSHEKLKRTLRTSSASALSKV